MRVEQPIALPASSLTNGSLTRVVSATLNKFYHKFTWANTDVAGLSGTTGSLTVCTLPAKTIVNKATIVITGQAASVTTLTVSLGRVGAAYIDYLVANSAKVAANTVYGDGIAEVGAGLSAILGDLPSLTTTTNVLLQFVSSIENLSVVTASSGEIHLETTLLT